MGNSHSIDNNLDHIITNYILSMKFNNLKKLHDKSYCNKLTGLTSSIIAKYYETKDIHYLLDRISYNELGKQHPQDKQKEDICNKISIFYVKIAHIYSTITLALNPKYVYTDKTGKEIIVEIDKAYKIPKNAIPQIKNMGLCNIYLDNLQLKKHTDKPSFCTINKSSSSEGC